jgi:hypothetical protein
MRSWLSQAEFWYNSSHHSSLGCSPFKALHGHETNVGAIPRIHTETSTSATEMVTELQAQVVVLKEHLARAQTR